MIAARMALQNPVIYTPAPVTDAAADDDCAIDTTAARASCNPAEASDLLLRKVNYTYNYCQPSTLFYCVCLCVLILCCIIDIVIDNKGPHVDAS